MTSRRRHVVDFWTVISVFGAKARIWFRMASKPNHGVFATLISDLELLTEDDAQEATDIVNRCSLQTMLFDSSRCTKSP